MTFSSKLFSCKQGAMFFCADVSTLMHGRPGSLPFEQLFPESADHGIRMRSERSGEEAAFFVVNTDIERDSDGSGAIVGWRLKPTLETLARIPSLKGYNMLIVNT